MAIKLHQDYLDIIVQDGKTFYKNITQDVQNAITSSNFQSGIVVVHTLHTTTGLTNSKDKCPEPTGFLVQEDEPLLMEDLKFALNSGAKKFLDMLPLIAERPRIMDAISQETGRLAMDAAISLIRPFEGFKHDNFEIRTVNMGLDERKNAEAHIKAAMIKESVLWTFSHGRLDLGQWQNILFWDFDPIGRKKRKINIVLIGE